MQPRKARCHLTVLNEVITQHGEMTVYQRSSTPRFVLRVVLKSAWNEQRQQDVLRSCEKLQRDTHKRDHTRPKALTMLRKKNARELKGGDKKAFFRSHGKLQRVETLTHTRKPSMLVLWKLTNLQGSVWSVLFREIMTTTSRRKHSNSLIHYNLVRKFIPMIQAMKIPDAKAAAKKEREKLEKIPAWQMGKVKSKKGCYS